MDGGEILGISPIYSKPFSMSCSCMQDGINWLAFLNKYKLHGILCDDILKRKGGGGGGGGGDALL